jgi:hypothetical protein
VANLLQLPSTGYLKSFSAHQTLAQHREDSFGIAHPFVLFRRLVARTTRYVGDLLGQPGILDNEFVYLATRPVSAPLKWTNVCGNHYMHLHSTAQTSQLQVYASFE